jgi:homocitrate synthase NifV
MKGLIDSTLREGGQMAGVSFRLAEKKRIITHLLRIGIEELEIGIATPSDPDLVELLAFCRRLAPPAPRLALWSPCRTVNINFALKLQPDILALSMPASEILIKKKLGRDRDWVLGTVRRSIALARNKGLQTISLGLEDATRAAPDFLRELIMTGARAGATRIRLADTLGIATPPDISALLRTVRGYYQGEIGVHLHNDFGMATANSLTALDAGSDYADVTVLGIGERAGNARLEEVVGFLALRNGRHYQTTALKPLAALLATLTGRTISAGQPVIGERIFHCESGLHLQGLRKDPATYEPFAPEKVGAERQLLYGAKIGKRDIKDCLEPLGIRLAGKQLEKLVREVRKWTRHHQRPLPPREFHGLLAAIHGRLTCLPAPR